MIQIIITYNNSFCKKKEEDNKNFSFLVGHEHLDEFDIINMNGRLYNPTLGRFLSPDPYVADNTYSQDFNRYSYCRNNPMMYTDPSGEFIVAIIAGALIGAYVGGMMANGTKDITEWNFNSGRTWGYMLGGALVGAASGAVGGSIASAGGLFSNTIGIMMSSHIFSLGTIAYTGGKMNYNISFGAASFNGTQGSWGYLGKKGNSVMENVGYGFGALANVQDIFAGVNGTNVDLIVEKKDAISHSALVDQSNGINISVGPYKELGEGINIEELKSVTGTFKELSRTMKGQIWENHATDGHGWKFLISNVNKNTLLRLSNTLQAKMDNQTLQWNLLGKSCVGYTSKALWSVGIPNLGGIHPYWLQLQMITRQLGIYSNAYLYQIPLY